MPTWADRTNLAGPPVSNITVGAIVRAEMGDFGIRRAARGAYGLDEVIDDLKRAFSDTPSPIVTARHLGELRDASTRRVTRRRMPPGTFGPVHPSPRERLVTAGSVPAGRGQHGGVDSFLAAAGTHPTAGAGEADRHHDVCGIHRTGGTG